MKDEYEEYKIFLREFNEKTIGFLPIYAKIAGSASLGLFLSQIVFWWKVVDDDEFYHTDEQFIEELFISRYLLNKGRTLFKELGLVESVRKGIPPKMYYKLDIQVLRDLVVNSSTKFKLSTTKNLGILTPKIGKTLNDKENNKENKEEEQTSSFASSSLLFNKINEEIQRNYRVHYNDVSGRLRIADDPKFTMAAKRFIEYFIIQEDTDFDTQIVSRVKDLFKAIRLYYQDMINRDQFVLSPGHLCSDLTWDVIMPAHGQWGKVQR